VGSIALFVMAVDFFLFDKISLLPSFSISNFIVWFIVAYFLGHIIQAIANIIVKENKSDFSESEKEILEQAKSYFNIKEYTLNELYSLCYMLSSVKDVTGQVQSFNTYYSLYRGWFVIFIFESLFLLIVLIINWFTYKYLLILVVSIFLSILFFRRLKKFYKYSRSKTLQTFILIKSSKL
jgi:hypothetical protein